jgi:hypothetical protein
VTNLLKMVGTGYLVLVCLYIIANYGLICWFQGFWKLTEYLSLSNTITWMMTVLTLLPGLLLLGWSDRRRNAGK